MSRRTIARHSFQFEDVAEYTTMRRYLAETNTVTAGRYNGRALYRPNLQSVALEAFSEITNPPIPPIPPVCVGTVLSGGSPSTLIYDQTDNGGSYDTETFTEVISGGGPDTNFC
jgi:hypothetical protein